MAYVWHAPHVEHVAHPACMAKVEGTEAAVAYVLLLFVVGALCAPLVMQRGRFGFAILALLPAGTFLWLLSFIPRILRGDIYQQSLTWVPQLGMDLDIRIDTLGLLLALIATGVGAAVLFYSARYFKRDASYLGRFGAIFVAFAGAMLGLVTTDNTIALYIYWELTTVFSFLLIGHYSDRQSSRRAAFQAIIVTTAGGLAMLGGITMLGVMPGGSFSLHELVVASHEATLSPGNSALLTSAVVLVLIGAFSKSALVPFHFWLPAAMAAPTPVSAYLHAAAMVKAGVYLVARLAPGFAHNLAWRWMVIILASYTVLLGGYRALKQTDIKLVTAFGTVSQLGLIILFVGYGDSAMLLAGLMLLLAHSLFKSALFLSVGIVDVCTGTRDLRELSNVGRNMPAVATFAGMADASMMGFPPFAAFVAKESALGALWGGSATDIAVLVLIAVGSALTVAYGLRFWWGAFMRKPRVEDTEVRDVSAVMIWPVGILATAGLVAGLATAPISAFLEQYLAQYPVLAPYQGHLHLWSGFNGPFLVTLAILAAGFLLFWQRHRISAFTQRHAIRTSAEEAYQRIVSGTERFSMTVTARTQSGSLPTYLLTIFWFLLITVGIALLTNPVGTLVVPRLFDSWAQAAVAVVGCLGVLLAAASRHRLKAVILMGIGGYAVALTYEMYGAPDLALTQVLSETLTLVVFVLVLRRLPSYFSSRRTKGTQRFRIVFAAIMGLLFAGLAYLAAGVRTHAPISELFADEGFRFGYGRNIVNVTLVDIRAWDTMGETSVLVVCAVGIASLLFVRDRFGGTDRLRNILGAKSERAQRLHRLGDDPVAYVRNSLRAEEEAKRSGRNRAWLASANRPGVASRPIMLQIGTRLVFHTVLIISLFFLFSGHNMPGGGFAGGLLAGIALTLRYLAGGRFELGATLPILPAHLLGTGLGLATLSSLAPIMLGGNPLQTAKIDMVLPIFGDVHFTTALIFDTGVYIAVVGLVAEILRSLGGEIDRHGEMEEGVWDADIRIEPSHDARQNLREEMESQAELSERTSPKQEAERLALAAEQRDAATEGEQE